jgi:hypothetical protein
MRSEHDRAPVLAAKAGGRSCCQLTGRKLPGLLTEYGELPQSSVPRDYSKHAASGQAVVTRIAYESRTLADGRRQHRTAPDGMPVSSVRL